MEEVQVKAVLWDFGGVITTSPFDAFGDYEAANGLEPGFVRQLNATNPDTNAWARLERSEVTAEEFIALFEAEAQAAGGAVDARALMAGLRGEIRPIMLEAVRRCAKVLKTGLLTNNFISGDPSADYLEVLSIFDVVVESSVVGARKPDPRFYQMACEQLDIKPAEAVFLDDLGINLKPAREMGMRTIKVLSPDQALSELQEIVGFQLI